MFFKNQFEVDEIKYRKKCNKNKEIAEKRWQKNNANASERIQTHNIDANHDDKEQDKDIDKDKEKDIINNKFNFKKRLIELVGDETLVNDYIEVRKKKKCAQTETAFKQLVKECEQNNFSIHSALEICVKKNWGGFEYAWLKKEEINGYMSRIQSIQNAQQIALQILEQRKLNGHE